MPIESVQDAITAVNEASAKRNRHNRCSEGAHYVTDILESLARNGLFTPLIGQKTAEVAERVNIISSQRLIESCRFALKDPSFDFDSYGTLFLLAHKRFGLRAGNNFGRNFRKMHGLGISAQDHYHHIETAVDAGGKVFGGYFAKHLPEVIEAGGSIDEFRSHSAHIRFIGGVKLARNFMTYAPGMVATKDPTLTEFTDTIASSIQEFGKDAGFWITRPMLHLSTIFNYPPQQFLADCTEIYATQSQAEKGERAVKWFAYGLEGITNARTALEKEVQTALRHFKSYSESPDPLRYFPPYIEKYSKLAREKTRQMEDYTRRVRPEVFKDRYLELLALTQQSVATFYSLMAHADCIYTQEFTNLPDNLSNFYQQVSKKVLATSMWFVPKIAQHSPEGHLTELLEDIIDSKRRSGDKATIEAIKYTWGCERRGTGTWGLIYPEPTRSFADYDYGLFSDEEPALDDEEEKYIPPLENEDECPF